LTSRELAQGFAQRQRGRYADVERAQRRPYRYAHPCVGGSGDDVGNTRGFMPERRNRRSENGKPAGSMIRASIPRHAQVRIIAPALAAMSGS
jgi:hypothetical protein